MNVLVEDYACFHLCDGDDRVCLLVGHHKAGPVELHHQVVGLILWTFCNMDVWKIAAKYFNFHHIKQYVPYDFIEL